MNQTLRLQALPRRAEQIQHLPGPGAKIVSYTNRSLHFGSGLIMAAPSIAKLILCRSLSDLLGQSNASKTEVICAGVDLTLAASADYVS